MGRKDLASSGQWANAGGQVTIPGNTRTVSANLAVWGEGDLALDDVSFAAPLDRPHDPDAVLSRKLQPDADALAFVDFDGQGQCRLEAGRR